MKHWYAQDEGQRLEPVQRMTALTHSLLPTPFVQKSSPPGAAGKGEREIERERKREKERGRETETETVREKETETERDSQTDRKRQSSKRSSPQTQGKFACHKSQTETIGLRINKRRKGGHECENN